MIKTRDERRMTKEKVSELAEVTGVSWCHPGAECNGVEGSRA